MAFLRCAAERPLALRLTGLQTIPSDNSFPLFLKLSHLAYAGSTFCLFLVIVSYLDVYTFKRML